jgi:transposase
MPRRTRANSGKQTIPPAGPVTVRRVKPTKGTAPKSPAKSAPAKPAEPKEPTYTEDEARDLLCQGYSPEQVAKRTGYSLNWVKKQRVPAKSLLDQALEKAGSPK